MLEKISDLIKEHAGKSFTVVEQNQNLISEHIC